MSTIHALQRRPGAYDAHIDLCTAAIFCLLSLVQVTARGRKNASGSRAAKRAKVSGQQVPAAQAKFKAPVQSMKEMLQHVHVDAPQPVQHGNSRTNGHHQEQQQEQQQLPSLTSTEEDMAQVRTQACCCNSQPTCCRAQHSTTHHSVT